MEMSEAIQDAFEGTKGTWIKFGEDEEGKVVVGLVTYFDPTGDIILNSTEKQPRLQILDADGETAYVSMTTVLRRELRELAPKIVPNTTIIRIAFEDTQPPKNPAYKPTKIIKAYILNPTQGDSPAEKATNKAYQNMLKANLIWDKTFDQ